MPKISELPAAESIADEDLIPIVQDGVTKRAAASLISATSAVADDIAKSAGSTIDRVQGFRGRSLASTTPLDGEAYSYDAASNTFKPAGKVIHLKRFGGVADGTTDCAQAFEDAINSITGDTSAVILLDPTGASFYRLSRTVVIPKTCIIKGHGSQENYPGTHIKADSGVTAFKIPFTAPNCVFEDIAVTQASRDTTTTTGNYTAGNADVPLTDASDFSVGQLISIDGAGIQFEIQEVTAAVSSGSPTVTLTGTGDQTPYAIIGWYLVIPGAFATPTRVTNVVGTTLTMASNASGTVTAATVTYCASLFAHITAKVGNTVTIDTTQLGVTSMTGAVVRHADTAFSCMSSVRMSRVSVGGPINGSVLGFQGPAWCFRGNLGDSPVKYASISRLHDCRCYGNRHGVFIQGGDANGGKFEVNATQGYSPSDWHFLDGSHLGNNWSRFHVDGGAGIITQDLPGCEANVDGYVESGTYCSFGSGTTQHGGTLPQIAGGTNYGRVMNRLQVGRYDLQTHQFESRPDEGAVIVCTETSGELRLALITDGAATGFMGWKHEAGFRSHSQVWAMNDNGVGWRVGTMWFPNDFMIGESSVLQQLDTTKASRVGAYRTNSTGRLNQDPAKGPYNSGEADFYAEWKKGDINIDASILDGCPLVSVQEAGHRADEWQASTNVGSYPAGNCCVPTQNNWNGRIYRMTTLGTTGGSEPNWTTAPNLNDTVNDGTAVWTNAGVAAWVQPVDIGGYMVKAITGNETWTQSTRAFLCERVEVTGALAGNATLTLPTGRYKRWFWNNTTGGFSLLLKCASGRTITVANNRGAWVGCDGSQTFRMSADVDPTA